MTQLPTTYFEFLDRFLTGMRENLGKHEVVPFAFRSISRNHKIISVSSVLYYATG